MSGFPQAPSARNPPGQGGPGRLSRSGERVWGGVGDRTLWGKQDPLITELTCPGH